MNQNADAFVLAPACLARSVSRTPTQWTLGTSPTRHALEVVVEAGGGEGFEVGDPQAERMVDHPVDRQVVVGRCGRVTAGHRVEHETAPAGHDVRQPAAAQRGQEGCDAVLHPFAEGDAERPDPEDGQHRPPANGFVPVPRRMSRAAVRTSNCRRASGRRLGDRWYGFRLGPARPSEARRKALLRRYGSRSGPSSGAISWGSSPAGA